MAVSFRVNTAGGRRVRAQDLTRRAHDCQTAVAFPVAEKRDSVPAPDQLELALERTLAAYERTMLAWIRTSGSLITFGFALFQSTLWEYVLEAVAEQPSIQDLILTPVAGSLVGELFNKWSLGILRKGNLNLGEKVLVFFLNPAYVVNNGYRAPE